MEHLESIKKQLISAIESQLTDIQHADAKELGEVMDMIKDIEEAMYYCEKTKMLKEQGEKYKSSGNNNGGFNMSLDSDNPTELIEAMMTNRPKEKTYYPPMEYSYRPVEDYYREPSMRQIDGGRQSRMGSNSRYSDAMRMYAYDSNGNQYASNGGQGSSGNMSMNSSSNTGNN